MQDSARYFENTAEEFAKQHGLSKSSTMDLFHKMGANVSLGLKTPIVELGIGAQTESGYAFHKSSSYNDTMNEMNKVAQGEEFQKHFQNLDRFSQGQNFNIADDEGNRLANEYSSSKERLSTYQNSYQDALSSLEQISTTQSLAKTDSSSIKANVTQDFMNWASEKYGSFENVKSVINRNEMDTEKRDLFREFNSEILPERLKNYYQPSSLTNKYNERSGWVKDVIGPKQDPQTPDNIATLLGLEQGRAHRKGSSLKDQSLENMGSIRKEKETIADKIRSDSKK